MTSGDSLSSFLINPGDNAAYIRAVKNGILYYDKVIISPKTDFACVILPEMPEIVNHILAKLGPNILKLSMALGMQLLAEGGLANLQERTLSILQPIIEKEADRLKNNDDFFKKSKAKIKGHEKNFDEIQQQLTPAIESGYAEIAGGSWDKEEFNPIGAAIANCFAITFMFLPIILRTGKTPKIPDSTITNHQLEIWAKHAAVMTSHYNCPLLTTSQSFMKYLNDNYQKLSLSPQLSPALANRRWRAQSLSFALNKDGLPDMSKVKLEDILELRCIADDILSSFRKAIKGFSNSLRLEPWEEGFEAEALAVIEDDIKPILTEAQKTFSRRPIKRILLNSKAAYAAPITSLGCFLDCFNLSEPILVALGGGVAPLLGLRKAIQELVEQIYVGDQNPASYNGMLFFLKAQKHLEWKSL